MSDLITVTGIVATTPRIINTSTGLSITSFRLASHSSYYDKAQQRFVEEPTNFYSVSTYRNFAENVGRSVHKGDHLVVTGKVKIKEWVSGEKTGTSVEIDAEALGHDLYWGQSHFSLRSPKGSGRYATTDRGINPSETFDRSELDGRGYSVDDFTAVGEDSLPPVGAFDDKPGGGLDEGSWPEVAVLPVSEEQTAPF